MRMPKGLFGTGRKNSDKTPELWSLSAYPAANGFIKKEERKRVRPDPELDPDFDDFDDFDDNDGI